MSPKMDGKRRLRTLPVLLASLALLFLTACHVATPSPTVQPPSPAPSSTVRPSPTVLPSRTNLPPTATLSPTLPPTLTPTPVPTPFYGEIQGVVYDNFTGQKQLVPGAEVRLAEAPDLVVTTDSNGTFHISGLVPALYHISTANRYGYGSIAPVSVIAGEVADLDIEIKAPIAMAAPPSILVLTTGGGAPPVLITCQGQPVPGAVLWAEGTQELYTADEKGLVFSALIPNSRYMISAGDCAGIFEVPLEGYWWNSPQLTIEVSVLPPGTLAATPAATLPFEPDLQVFLTITPGP